MNIEDMSSIRSFFQQHSAWSDVQHILETLDSNGFLSYLAGGCVRDALLEKIPKDFDIATSAQSDQILELFPNSNKQGKAFGVVAVFCSHGQVEIATFRKDGPYIDGRHPEYVEFLSDKEDALRRDFTINALFYHVKTDKIIDYVDGLKDLNKGIIRTIGLAEERFKEDKLRLIRAIRFSIQLNFELESDTKNKILMMKDTLLEVARERVYDECVKILETGLFSQAMEAFKDLGLLEHICSEWKSIDWVLCQQFWNGLQFSKEGEREDGVKFFLSSSSLTSTEGIKNTALSSGFLWIYALYPLLMQRPDTVINSRGVWHPSFVQSLKAWKFPRAVIKGMNKIFYSSYCLCPIENGVLAKGIKALLKEMSLDPISSRGQDFVRQIIAFIHGQERGVSLEDDIKIRLSHYLEANQEAESFYSLAKKLRLLDSLFSKQILFLSKGFFRKNIIAMVFIEHLEKEFKKRAPTGTLPKPLVKGEDLKSLGIEENAEMAIRLNYLYDYQLEAQIMNKSELLSFMKHNENQSY